MPPADQAPAAAPAAAPAPSPSPAPAAAPAPSPVPAASPAPAPSPAPEAAAASPAPEAAKPAEALPAEPAKADATVLGAEPPKPAEAPKPAETPKPAEGEKPPEAKESKEGSQSAEPAPPPTFEAFKLPEGVTVRPEIIGEFSTILGEFEGAAKADHAAVQALGQRLVDFHVARVNDTVKAIQESYQKAWSDQTAAWKKEFTEDPEIGGNRQRTTVDSALNFIRNHGGSEVQQAQLRDLFNKTGIGNHPAMIRLLANAGMAMSEGRPLAARAPAAQPKSKTQTLYGKSSAA